MLKNTPVSAHSILQCTADVIVHAARDIGFTDDLLSFGATLEGLQRKVNLVSTYAMDFNLAVAAHKLRAFLYRGLSASRGEVYPFPCS